MLFRAFKMTLDSSDPENKMNVDFTAAFDHRCEKCLEVCRHQSYNSSSGQHLLLVLRSRNVCEGSLCNPSPLDSVLELQLVARHTFKHCDSHPDPSSITELITDHTGPKAADDLRINSHGWAAELVGCQMKNIRS